MFSEKRIAVRARPNANVVTRKNHSLMKVDRLNLIRIMKRVIAIMKAMIIEGP